MVVCACGAELEVPTLLRLTAMEQEEAAVTAAPAAAAWGLRQAIALVGLAILLASLIGAVTLLFRRPALPTVDPERVHAFIERMPPAELYRDWKMLREQGLDPKDTAMVDAYNEAVLRYRLWWGAVLLGAVLGIAAIVVPLAGARRRDRVPRPPRPC